MSAYRGCHSAQPIQRQQNLANQVFDVNEVTFDWFAGRVEHYRDGLNMENFL